ncbi:DNA adenine methylase [soil metagenome]
MRPERPVLRWHGGKWKLAPWIISHFPPHRVYVEPFGGAASVLLRKPAAYAEIYNDLDDEVVNLFTVLRDRVQAARLVEALRLTPFARREFELSYQPAVESVERARRLIVLAFMGFGSNAHAMGGLESNGRCTGFRANSSRLGTTPAMDWRNYPDALEAIVARFRGVVIEHRPAEQVMASHDAMTTLHYVDPPYMAGTRSPANKYDLKYRMYRHELSDADHASLLDTLRGLQGMVVVSGYASDLYEDALKDWRRVEMRAHADSARDRTEVLWLNPRCAAQLHARGSCIAQTHLFEACA